MANDDTIDDGGGSPHAHRSTPTQPTRLGRYRIIGQVGAGGFGIVYRGYDDELHRDVAIKVPHRHRITSEKEGADFLAEARNLAILDHPGIVPVYDVGRSDEDDGGTYYMVFKFIEGHSLSAQSRRGQNAPPLHAVSVVRRVAEAMHHAHHNGIIHRDVKPSNILLDGSGRPYLTDFGLALRDTELHEAQGIVGTPAYMSPEQICGEGHRLDARTDIYSLGVVLYELLVGQWPFHGLDKDELRRKVRKAEITPLGQLAPSVPPELQRVCHKAISRRVADRYSTAIDFAEELRGCEGAAASLATSMRGQSQSSASQSGAVSARSVYGMPSAASVGATGNAPQSASMQQASVRSGSQAPVDPAAAPQVVPKGLRSFDPEDADFFLDLLPGPRDREGLPDVIRFWKGRIEETDSDLTFPVGLVYGPSGCGKSSLIKAGLLPRLAEHVGTIYLEATGDGTEARLRAALRRRFPALPPDADLRDLTSTIRRGAADGTGEANRKLLIVIDQFEQWLHAHPDPASTDLVRALRQCDGAHLQCLVMVRDDFWMAVTGFMRDVEVKLVEGKNSAAVDLFSLDHARRVLLSFGRAFGTLPATDAAQTAGQQQFLKQAVEALATEAAVTPVRLSLFADMVKNRPWTAATLRDVGGTEGLGVTFLEETFSGVSAPPEHRRHIRAARSALAALLPGKGTDIKGSMRSRAQLLEASGYAAAPKEFDELLHVLDAELRLVTPTDPLGAQDAPAADPEHAVGQWYQLTHDFLVPAVREWLLRKQRETRRGRAQLLLADKALVWSATPQGQFLPTLAQSLGIRALVPRRQWSPSQRRMMRASARRQSLVAAILAVTASLAGWGASEGYQSIHAQALRDRLLYVKTQDVPAVIQTIQPHRARVRPLLVSALPQFKSDSSERLNLALALLNDDPAQIPLVLERAFDVDPADLHVLRDALIPHAPMLTGSLWGRLEDARVPDEQRLRAALMLARFDPPLSGAQTDRWRKSADYLAARLLITAVKEPARYNDLIAALMPVSSLLIDPLRSRSHDPALAESDRTMAASLLLEYAAERPDLLAEIILNADNPARQGRAISLLKNFPGQTEKLLKPELARTVGDLKPLRNDPVLDDDDDQPLPPALVAQLDGAGGVADDYSALCQSLPLEVFTQVAAGLRDAGLRPRRVRPYHLQGQQVRIAASWTRDGRDAEVKLGLTEDEARAVITADQMKQALLADLAAYEDATGAVRYAAVTLRRRPEDPECAGYIGPEQNWSDFYKDFQGFGVVSHQVRRADKTIVCKVLWKGDSSGALEERSRALLEKQLAEPYAGRVQTDVSVVPNPSDDIASAMRARYENQLRGIEQSLATNPKNWMRLINRVQCNMILGHCEDVIRDATRYLKEVPETKPPSWQAGVCREYLIIASAQLGRMSDADQFLATALADDSRPYQSRCRQMVRDLFGNEPLAVMDTFEASFTGNVDASLHQAIANYYSLAARILRQRAPQQSATCFERAMAHLTTAIEMGSPGTELFRLADHTPFLLSDARARALRWDVELNAIAPIKLARTGDAKGARAALQKYMPNSPNAPERIRVEVVTEAFLGEDVAAVQALEENLKRNPSQKYWGGAAGYAGAAWAVKQKHPDRAKAYIARAIALIEEHGAELGWVDAFRAELLFDWPFTPLESEPAFQQIIERDRFFYGACFTNNADVEATELHGLSIPQHQAKARELAAKGFRPVAIDAAALPDGVTEVASVWHRPLVTQRQKIELARRQATVAAALIGPAGAAAGAWPLLAQSPDPTLRTFLIQRMGALGVSPTVLWTQLEHETEPAHRRAILLALGETPDDRLPSSARDAWLPKLLTLYKSDPDAGVHGASEWLLRKWGDSAQIAAADTAMPTGAPPPGQGWWRNAAGDTLVLVPGPVSFRMGSEPREPARQINETPHQRKILRAFAVAAKPVSHAQLLGFLDANPTVVHAGPRTGIDPAAAASSVTWFEAAAYCRWLSQQEGLPEDEMCYPPIDQIKSGMLMPADYLSRAGYRLPTEAEWEAAARAGSNSTYFFGAASELLARFAWCKENSREKPMPVGLLLPNDWGIFDACGNVWNWCQHPSLPYPIQTTGQAGDLVQIDAEHLPMVNGVRAIRGGSYQDDPPMLRSANRNAIDAKWSLPNVGFRIARTVLPPEVIAARTARREAMQLRERGNTAAAADRAVRLVAAEYERLIAKYPETPSYRRELIDLLLSGSGAWTVLSPTEVLSAKGATFTANPDGTILASGNSPTTDTITITAPTSLSGIVALEIEALPHPTLPAGGPGRDLEGKFRITDIRLTAAPASDPKRIQVIPLRRIIARSLDPSANQATTQPAANDASSSWAMLDQPGVPQWAIFEIGRPIDAAADGGGAILQLHLECTSKQGNSLVPGFLRISVANQAQTARAEQVHLFLARGQSGALPATAAAYALSGDWRKAAEIASAATGKSTKSSELAAMEPFMRVMAAGDDSAESRMEFQRALQWLDRNPRPDGLIRWIATQALARALERTPENIEILNSRAQLLAAAGGDRASARADYRTLAALEPTNDQWAFRISQLDDDVVTAWNFDRGVDGWQAADNCTIAAAAGVLTVNAIAAKSRLQTDVSAAAGCYELLLRTRYEKDAQVELRWGLQTDQVMKNRSVRTQISASPGHAKDHALYFFAEDGLGALNLQPAAGTGRWPIESIVLRQVTVQHAAEQLEARRATLPPAGLEMLSTLNSLAMLYKANAQHDKAEPICEQILEASRKRYGEAHRDTMAAAAELGVTSLKMHHADRGQQLLRQVGDWCLAQPAGDQVAAALANIALPPLIASYHETAKQALAREWEAKLNALKQSDGSWQWEIERQLTAITRELASVTDAPPRAKLLKSRGMQKLKLSRFEEADADFQQSLELDQKDDFLKYQHACLLAYLGNSDPWAQYCNTLLNGQLPAVVVSRTAKACLLLDPPAADPKKLLAMTEQAIAQAATAKTVPSTVAWYHHTHALALYRTGNFTACLAAIDKSEEIKPIPVEREPISKLLRAMALHRMGRHEQATAAFDQGINLIERKLSPLHTFDTEKSGIENWLVAQIFRRQAETLFRAPSTNPATNTSR